MRLCGSCGRRACVVACAALPANRRLAELPVVAEPADVDVGSSYDVDLLAKIMSKHDATNKLQALFGGI